MKARLFANTMHGGHVARDYIRLVQRSHSSTGLRVPPNRQTAHAVLESFGDQDRAHELDPVVPIKSLIPVLTESLRGTPGPRNDDEDGIEGANLYRGCRVRLRGISDRQFVVREIFWDYGEVRIKEIGQDRMFYLVPWDCLEIVSERAQ
jgi:hypothetical protein